MKNTLITCAVLAVIVGLFWLRWTVWSECRETHSWFFCAQVLGSR